jgi:hypothetical protein
VDIRWGNGLFKVCGTNRNGSVGIATGYGPDDRGAGVRVPVRVRFFSTSSRPVLGPTQLPIRWVPGALSPGVKSPGREADPSPPTSAEVKKTWIYTSTPPYVLSLLGNGKFPLIVASQRLGRNVTAVTNTHATIEELLDASFSMRPVSYQGK